MEISEQYGFNDITVFSLVNIASTYAGLGDHENAIAFCERALPIAILQGNRRMESAINTAIGNSLIYAPDSVLYKNNIKLSERFDTAFTLISKSISIGKEINNLQEQMLGYGTLAELDSAKKDYEKALTNYKKYVIIRDSILNDKTRKELDHLSMQYVYDKKEDSLKLEHQITNVQLKQQQLLAKQQEQKLILGKKEIDLINKEKDIQKLAYLKTQADLENEQLQKEQKIKQLNLSEKEKQLQASLLTNLIPGENT
jgi:tetratricopeptide (TPR) repeat protein